MISKISNFQIINKNYSKNNNLKNHCFYNNYYGDTVSFSGSNLVLNAIQKQKQKENNDNIKVVTDFGIELLESLDTLSDETLRNKIQEFFKHNNVNNIKIKNLDEHPDKNVRSLAAGCFNPEINDNLQGLKSGTLYIKNIPDNIKNKECATAYIAFICHEMTHAMQYAKDNSNFGFDGEINSLNEANKIFILTNNLKPKILPELQMNPLTKFCQDYEKFALSRTEVEKLIMTTQQCQMPIFDKAVEISDSYIINAISPQIPLEKKVDAIVNGTIDSYIKHNNIPSEKQNSIKKAILKRYIYEFRTECEAYNVACEIIKKQYNIQGDCVYNMTPRAYKIIEEILINMLSNYN